jgi:hypothetical protein
MGEAAAGPPTGRTAKRPTSTAAAGAAAKTSRPAKTAAPPAKKASPTPATRATTTAARSTGKTNGTAPIAVKRATAKAGGTAAKTTGTATRTAAAGKTTATPTKTARTSGTAAKASGASSTTPATRAAAKSSPARTPRPAAPRPAIAHPEPETERIFTPPRPVADESRPKASSVIADLWLEREEQIRAAVPEPVVEARRPRPATSSSISGKGGLVAALVAVAVLLGGAVGLFLAQGGGGAPSKATFIAKADALCGAADTSIASLAKPTSYPELATAMGTVVTATDAQVAGLAKVHVPAGIAGTAAADAIASLTTTSQAAHSLAEAAGKKDDAATATATSHLMTQYAEAATKAKAFGFTACASSMQPGMDNVTGGAKGLVKATFTAKADSLCREASRKLDAIPPFKANGADVARYFGQGVAITIKTATDLRSLAAPPGDEAVVADMLAAQDKFNAKLGELRDAAAAGDQARFIAAGNELDVLGTASDAKFDAYGLSVCGSNFGES